jgi:hypothetical protein
MQCRRKFAQIWLVLLLSGVGGASLIPPGYMPGINATGALSLVLCSGEVINTRDEPNSVVTSVCWFAATQQTAALHLVPNLNSFTHQITLYLVQETPEPESLSGFAYHARGPPLRS